MNRSLILGMTGLKSKFSSNSRYPTDKRPNQKMFLSYLNKDRFPTSDLSLPISYSSFFSFTITKTSSLSFFIRYFSRANFSSFLGSEVSSSRSFLPYQFLSDKIPVPVLTCLPADGIDIERKDRFCQKISSIPKRLKKLKSICF